MLDKKYIRDIADILVEKNLGEIEIDGTRLRITAKNIDKNVCVMHETITRDNEQTPSDDEVITEKEIEIKTESEIFELKAPIGGKFYKAPYPNGQDFVFVGKKIKTGDTIGIIETNKGKHHIPSPVDGEIVEIMATQFVDFGKAILKIKK